jgi:hypothetical protein
MCFPKTSICGYRTRYSSWKRRYPCYPTPKSRYAIPSHESAPSVTGVSSTAGEIPFGLPVASYAPVPGTVWKRFVVYSVNYYNGSWTVPPTRGQGEANRSIRHLFPTHIRGLSHVQTRGVAFQSP